MKRTVLITIITSMTALIWGQDHIYNYGVNGKILEDEKDAIIQKRVWHSGNRNREKVYVSTPEGWMWIRTENSRMKKSGQLNIRYRHETFFPKTLKRITRQTEPGLYYFRDEKGKKVLRVGTASSLVPLHLESKITENHPNGEIKSESYFNNNELVNNMNWNEDGSEYVHNIFYSADQPPLYAPGQKFLQNYIVAQMAEKRLPVNEIQDEVLIGGVVLENGELTGIRILKGRVKSVNDFFTETFESLPGKWEPAVLDGKAVRYFITFPVNFYNEIPMLQHVELTPGGQMFWHD